jgi:hypothetical protein
MPSAEERVTPSRTVFSELLGQNPERCADLGVGAAPGMDFVAEIVGQQFAVDMADLGAASHLSKHAADDLIAGNDFDRPAVTVPGDRGLSGVVEFRHQQRRRLIGIQKLQALRDREDRFNGGIIRLARASAQVPGFPPRERWRWRAGSRPASDDPAAKGCRSVG